MRNIRFSSQILGVLLIGAMPAFAIDGCNDVEPICDFPAVPVCVQHTQSGYVQSGWRCQNNSKSSSSSVISRSKAPIKEKNSNSGFFPDDFVQGRNDGFQEKGTRAATGEKNDQSW